MTASVLAQPMGEIVAKAIDTFDRFVTEEPDVAAHARTEFKRVFQCYLDSYAGQQPDS